MNRIRLLSEQVANQIAAGEVVERPASVVKELVENALDASATRIQVDILAGGRSLIKVSDNGSGMNRDDALMCLERHATSKINRAEDLSSLHSMGFRGEAIPSIASVSRFSLTTCARESENAVGTQIVIHGGKILEVKEAGHAPGTTVEVRQIFYNLPARRKFLKTEETERAHVQHVLTLAALAHPEVGFTFRSQQRTVWNLPPNDIESPESGLKALNERLGILEGSNRNLLSILPPEEGTIPELIGREITIWGLMGAPGLSRSSRDHQHLFVNRRPVDNRGLNFALLEGYHTSLMKGRFPVCCLFLEIDPGEVDVNIHPSKREIKFHHEQAVRRYVAAAIRHTLLHYHSGRASEPSAKVPQAVPARHVPDQTRNESVPRPTLPDPLPGSDEIDSLQPSKRDLFPQQIEAQPVPSKEVPHVPDPVRDSQSLPECHTEDAEPSCNPSQTRFSNLTEVEESSTGGSSLGMPLLAVPLRLVGVIGRLYVVLESDRGLVLLDQHAAHERILFEQMMDRMEKQGEAPSQKLLLPETVELSPRDAEFLRENLELLSRLGVGLSDFGDRTFLLDGLPPFVKSSDARTFTLELIDELSAAGKEVNTMRLGEHVVAKTVCRHAVKANDPLAEPELIHLLKDLKRCQMPYTCPHGRPTLIEMSFKELEKKFGRVQ